MEDFRIIGQNEQEKEKLFEKELIDLAGELKVHRIEYQIYPTLSPPILITNGDTFEKDKNITQRAIDIYSKIFNDGQ